MRADVSLELDILAAVLQDPRLTGPMMRLLEAEDFASERTRRLFDAMAQIAKRDGRDAVAPATVRAELQRSGADEREVLAVMDPVLGQGLFGSFEPKCHRLRDLRRHRRIERGFSDLLATDDVEVAVGQLQELVFEVGRLAGRESASLADVIDELLDERERELSDEARIRTGLPTLDLLLRGGIGPGWFTVIASRTGVGKTTLAVQIAAQALKAERRVLYVSLEEDRRQIAERLIRHVHRIAPSRAGQIDRLFSAALDEHTRAMPLVIETGADLEAIVSQIGERAMESEGLGLAVVDYVGLVRTRRRENRVQEVSEVTRRLKNLAMELHLPIVGMAQINRGSLARSDARPVLSDLKDSGSLEEDADAAILLHRTDAHVGAGGLLRLAKNRYGSTAEFEIAFEYPVGRINEVTAR